MNIASDGNSLRPGTLSDCDDVESWGSTTTSLLSDYQQMEKWVWGVGGEQDRGLVGILHLYMENIKVPQRVKKEAHRSLCMNGEEA